VTILTHLEMCAKTDCPEKFQDIPHVTHIKDFVVHRLSDFFHTLDLPSPAIWSVTTFM